MSYVYITEDNAKLQKKGGKYLVGRNLEVVMSIPEETSEAKIHNQGILLKRYNRRSGVSGVSNKITQINFMEDRVVHAADKEKAMGFEGIAARNYFEALPLEYISWPTIRLYVHGALVTIILKML